MTEIPEKVLETAQYLIDQYGENIIMAGQLGIWSVYLFEFPANTVTGFPFVFLYDTELDDVTTISGFDALDMLNSLKRTVE